MKKYNIYLTQEMPNGTSDLIITDSDGQVVECIDEAVFGLWNRVHETDSLGGCMGLTNGEYVDYFDSSCEAIDYDNDTEQDVILDKTFPELLCEFGEYQGIELVKSVGLSTVLKYIAVSPVNGGTENIETLNKYFNIGGLK